MADSGGFAGGFFAIYIPPLEVDHDARTAAMMADSYDLPLPPQLDWSHAVTVTMAQINILLELERRRVLGICHSVADIREAISAGSIAAIMFKRTSLRAIAHALSGQATPRPLGLLDSAVDSRRG